MKSPERLKVTLECLHELLYPDFIQLLNQIIDSYPETATGIEETLLPKQTVDFKGEILPEATEAHTRNKTKESEEERPKWFPNTDTTREIWAEAYKIILEIEEEFRDNGRKPLLRDFKYWIEERMGYNRGERTISNIKKAGDNGWLNEWLEEH